MHPAVGDEACLPSGWRMLACEVSGTTCAVDQWHRASGNTSAPCFRGTDSALQLRWQPTFPKNIQQFLLCGYVNVT